MWQPQGFYNQYVLRSPLVLTGAESVRGLYNYPAAKIAVIHGKSFKDRDLFEETFAKRSICFVERSWQGEPDFNGLADTIQELEKFKPDTIIAVGGGSVIDGGKLCRLLYEFPYFVPNETRITGDLFKTKFIAIPTTVGSGSEVSSAAVFIDHDKHGKDMIVMHELQPEAIVYDKRYVEHTPRRLLVASALDAMTHILEGYVSSIDNDFMDVMAEKGMAILSKELPKLLNNEGAVNYERLQYAGYLGGLVQNHCIVGAAHGVAHQLTESGYSHGEAVALLLPSVLSLNAESEAVANKYQDVSRQTGFADFAELKNFIRQIVDAVGIGEKRESLKALLKDLLQQENFGKAVRDDRGGKGNPVPITDEYLVKLAEIM